jgi:SprT-like protein
MVFPLTAPSRLLNPRGVHLLEVFSEINRQHFDDFLSPPEFRWNSRLRSSAGRFIPGSRRFFQERPPVIEIASYLLDEAESAKLIRDTMAHEIIHYWLWVRKRPYGHTDEFHAKLELLGASRYNSVPRMRAPKYLYICPACGKEFKTRRRLKPVACLDCCRAHAGGHFHPKFLLILMQEYSARERAEMARTLNAQLRETACSVTV